MTVSGNVIYRKPQCPWGKKALEMLNEKGITFVDRPFSSKEDEQALKERYSVSTTPQIFLEGQRIGGFDELQAHFDIEPEEQSSSYIPVIAIFSSTALLALALTSQGLGFIGAFMGLSIAFLAVLKLMNVNGFAQGFVQYDLLTKRWPAYAKLYPFAELAVGLGIVSGMFVMPTAILAVLLGGIGGVSVVKAVYIDKQDLNCACVGGDSNVPLGAISFLENAMMILMGLWMLLSTLSLVGL